MVAWVNLRRWAAERPRDVRGARKHQGSDWQAGDHWGGHWPVCGRRVRQQKHTTSHLHGPPSSGQSIPFTAAGAAEAPHAAPPAKPVTSLSADVPPAPLRCKSSAEMRRRHAAGIHVVLQGSQRRLPTAPCYCCAGEALCLLRQAVQVHIRRQWHAPCVDGKDSCSPRAVWGRHMHQPAWRVRCVKCVVALAPGPQSQASTKGQGKPVF